jgi:hypothetical protein
MHLLSVKRVWPSEEKSSLFFCLFLVSNIIKLLKQPLKKKRLTIADALVALSLYTPDAHLEQV